MANTCKFLSALEGRLTILKDKFLKDQLEQEAADPLQFMPDPDKLAAFRLLAHAEFEEFLESKAREGVQSIQGAFRNGTTSVANNVPTLVIAMALGRTLRFEPAYWTSDVQQTMKEALDWIAENNGIKEGSFTKLSIFSGKMPDEVDSGLSASLTSYGASRGEVAHRSVSRVRTLMNPSTELKAAEGILADLKRYFS